MPDVVLSKGRAKPAWAGHPLIYAGAIERVDGSPATGDEVDVLDHKGRYIGRGVFHAEAPVRVRIYRTERGPLDADFVRGRIEDAARLRTDILGLAARTDAYRLVHGDGDRFPGLAADRYGAWVTVSVSARAAADRREAIAAALLGLPGVEGVWERPQKAFAEVEGFHAGGGRLAGAAPPDTVTVREGGVEYSVDLRAGAKTGHFLDQRDNRARFAALCGGRTVLDAFSGTGGFGLSALVAGGAGSVLALDVSGRALTRLGANAELNGVADRVKTKAGDGFESLRELDAAGRRFGAVSLDPPRFAASRRELPGALRGYHEVNLRAIRLTEKGGILATSSCTGVLDEPSFLRMLRDAAADAGRRVQVLHVGGQGPDHPWLTAVPESRYLKFVLARVL